MGGERVERRIATILAADAAGYSRMMSEDGSVRLVPLNDCRTEIADLLIGRMGDTDRRFFRVLMFGSQRVSRAESD
ncbi:MAG: hypothetical protein ACREUU_04760 [Gammaproteobacteria bacterium]